NVEHTMRYYRTLVRLPNDRYRRRAQQGLRVLHAERLQSALSERRGVVLLTVHIGIFELAASWITEVLGARVAAPASRSTLLPLRYVDERARAACGVVVRPSLSGVVSNTLDDLRSGAVVPIMLDRRPVFGGRRVRFFGCD